MLNIAFEKIVEAFVTLSGETIEYTDLNERFLWELGE